MFDGNFRTLQSSANQPRIDAAEPEQACAGATLHARRIIHFGCRSSIGLIGGQTALLLCLCLSPVSSTFANVPESPGSVVTLDKALHFPGPNDIDIVAEPGNYAVEKVGESRIRLIRVGTSESIEVDARTIEREQTIDTTKALVMRDDEGMPHVLLLSPGRKGLDATGSFTGIASRTLPQQLLASPIDKAGRIEAFVRQFFIEGVPYEEGSRFTSADVPILLAMLKNPSEEPYWSNVVMVLGMIGDPIAVDPLITLLERGESRTVAQYRGKKCVLPALGYIVKRSGDQRALGYLMDSLKPGIWTQRNVMMFRPDRRVEPSMTPEKQRDLRLSKMAIMGLALSGHPAAEARLRALQTGEVAISPELGAKLRPRIEEALKANQTIRNEGLETYFKKERLRSQQLIR